MRTAVVLSGGIDSSTALAMAKAEGDDVHAVTFKYGQKHEVEIWHAQAIATHYQVPYTLIALPEIFNKGALAGDEEMPHLTYEELSQASGPSATYVPFRNGSMLSLATAYCLTQECERLMIGAHAEDARNWAYPDCTPQFMQAMGEAINVGSYFKVRLAVPFQYMSKDAIIEKGLGLNVPYEKTWSCYDPQMRWDAMRDQNVTEACGKCPTCVARLAAFERIGVSDPATYVTEAVK